MTGRRWIAACAAGGLLAGLQTMGAAMEAVRTDDFSLDVNGRMQLLGVVQNVRDDVRDDERLYLFMKQARLGFTGAYKEYRYDVQLGFAGEEEVRAPSPGVSLNLLDFSIDLPVRAAGPSRLRVGQFKVPYGRERLADSADLLFAERSIATLGFRMGRDVGIAWYGTTPGNLRGCVGMFAGGGRDVPERYIPEDLGVPMLVARGGYDEGIDPDPFTGRQADRTPAGTLRAVYLNALYMEDSRIGHSTVHNVKTAEKSLVLNSNWNPYIARAPLDGGTLSQFGADAALRMPLGSFAFCAQAEAHYAEFENRYGQIDLAGGAAQAGLSRGAIDAALRYAVLFPDGDFNRNGATITGDQPFHEITPAITYHLDERAAKLVLDFPILLDAPVVTEDGVGAYVLTEQPDQASLVNYTRNVERQDVVEARLLFQVRF